MRKRKPEDVGLPAAFRTRKISDDSVSVEFHQLILAETESVHKVDRSECSLKFYPSVGVVFPCGSRDMPVENVKLCMAFDSFDDVDILHDLHGFIEPADGIEQRPGDEQ